MRRYEKILSRLRSIRRAGAGASIALMLENAARS